MARCSLSSLRISRTKSRISSPPTSIITPTLALAARCASSPIPRKTRSGTRWRRRTGISSGRSDRIFQTGRTHEQWWSFDGRIFFEHDPTERFFGLGNDSRLGGESNYQTKQVYVRALFGWNISKILQLALSLPAALRAHQRMAPSTRSRRRDGLSQRQRDQRGQRGLQRSPRQLRYARSRSIFRGPAGSP